MNTKQLWVAVVLATGIFTGNAQTNTANSSITSRGLNAGTLGIGNAFFGYRAGNTNTATGLNNTFMGHNSGQANTTGDSNVFLGGGAGFYNSTGTGNVYIGTSTGTAGEFGSKNTFIGAYAGLDNEGSGNIFIGSEAGASTTGSNKLNIDNSDTSTPLIWGDFASDLLKFNGKVGIGMGTTAFPNSAAGIDVSDYKLIVNGGILAKSVRVATLWADYVFEDNYRLAPLSEVECFIEENGHLPNVPSAKQVEKEGIEIGQMAKIQQEKIEELTLYLIEQNKQLEKQQKEIEDLKALVLAMADKKQVQHK